MGPLTAPRQLYEDGISSVDSKQQVQLGAPGVTADGGVFRYVQAGSAIAANSLVVAGARVTNHQNKSVAANVSVGDKIVTVTLGATAATQDQYAGGRLEVISGTGAGSILRVSGNGAAAASGTVTLILANQSTVALDTTSKVNLVASDYAGVQNSTTVSELIGVALTAIPSGSYGWVKTQGDVLVSASAAVAQGAAVIQDTTTAGDIVAAPNASTSAAPAAVAGQALAATSAAGLVPVRITLE